MVRDSKKARFRYIDLTINKKARFRYSDLTITLMSASFFFDSKLQKGRLLRPFLSCWLGLPFPFFLFLPSHFS